MTESATATPAVQRRHETSSRITAVCRTLTAERGLSGYTIEEVCSEVGISRRTFFNYFPSKEEAVFGVVEHDQLQEFVQEFLARGSRGWPAVVDDLIEIIGRACDAVGHNAADHSQFMIILEREPRLLARFVGMTREHDKSLVELVALRESVPTSDARARASVAVVSTILRELGDHIADPSFSGDFSATLTDSLATMREVLASTRKAHS